MIDDAFIARMASKCLLTDEALDAAIRDGGAKRIQTVNLHHLALAKRDDAFAAVIDAADHVTADGWPIVTLMRSHGVEAERVTGSELLARMIGDFDFAGQRVGILGSAAEHGDTVHALLVEHGMSVVFREHGDKADWDTASIAERLNADEVDLLLVAVTPPFGDAIAEQVRVAGFTGVVLNVGGSISMAAGAVSFAPRWVRKTRTEWFYRFVQEPGRLFRRYFVDCMPVFARYVLPSYWTSQPQLTALPSGQVTAEAGELTELNRAA